MTFITFEGGEGAGKTTLIESVAADLKQRGFPVEQTRAPGATAAGAVMRNLLLHHKEPLSPKTELFLYLADRAEHVAKVIQPALDLHKIVLCDRYNDSTIAYQSGGRGFPLSLIQDLCGFATGGLQPTLTFYLDIDPEIGLQRVGRGRCEKDKIESEQLVFHQAIRTAYQQIAREDPARVCILNGELSPEELLKMALDRVNRLC